MNTAQNADDSSIRIQMGQALPADEASRRWANAEAEEKASRRLPENVLDIQLVPTADLPATNLSMEARDLDIIGEGGNIDPGGPIPIGRAEAQAADQ